MVQEENKNNGQKLWEILERIIGKIKSIIVTGLIAVNMPSVLDTTAGNTWEMMLHLYTLQLNRCRSRVISS